MEGKMRIRAISIPCLAFLQLCISSFGIEGSKKPVLYSYDSSMVSVDTLLGNLNDPSWENRLNFLRKIEPAFSNDLVYKQDLRIKAKLIELLTGALKMQEDFFTDSLKSGKSQREAMEIFNKEYEKKGFGAYPVILAHIIASYKIRILSL